MLRNISVTIREYNLNEGQKAAAEGFFQFLFSDEKELIISGGGGVGKTYTMGYLIDETMRRYFEMCKLLGIEPEFDAVDMTATTNKAAEALSLATMRPTSTIHSFLNLKVKDDFRSGKSILTRGRDWHPHKRKILFVDECSMIDPALDQERQDATLDCKIVYVGDHCQLAPVGYSQSPIYNRRLPFFELTEPMRNAGQPALIQVCNQLRKTVETGVFEPIKIVPGVIDLLDDAQMEKQIDIDFLNSNHQNRILAFTNNRVIEYNDHIRQLRQLPYEFTVGEFLVNNSAVHLEAAMLPAEKEIEILDMRDPEEIQIGEQDGQPIIMIIHRSTIRTSIGDVHKNIPIPEDRKFHQELMKYYSRLKNWNRYFHLKNFYPDLRQRDASTIHKAQGSTYEMAFIDLANISTCNIPSQVARMLYVAFSRARNRIYLYGNLAEKYGGLIT